MGDPTEYSMDYIVVDMNYYGHAIVPPEYFYGDHVAHSMGKGLPPVCSCNWTPHGDFTMADHLRDMAEGLSAGREP